MRAVPHPKPDDIDLASLWGALRRSTPWLALLSLLAGGATFAILSMIAPRYVSEATLAIVAEGSTSASPGSRPVGARPAPPSGGVDTAAIDAHVRALQSPGLAAQVASALKLGEKVEFNAALGSPDALSRLLRMAGVGGPRSGVSEDERVLSAVFKRLEITSPRESRSIGIRFTSIDPELAAGVANTLAESYRSQLAAEIVAQTESAIAQLTSEAAAADAELERLRGTLSAIASAQQQTGSNEQQLAALTAEQSKSKAALSEAEARARSAREMLLKGNAEAIPGIQQSPVFQNLVQQRGRVGNRVVELSASLLPAHPRMRQLKSELASLDRQIAAEAGRAVDGLETEAKAAAQRDESLAKSLGEITARIAAAEEHEAKLRGLEALAGTKRTELVRLRSQLETNRAGAESGALPVDIQIAGRARAASVPVSPRTLPYALLVAVATLLLGSALMLTRATLLGVRQAASEAALAAEPTGVGPGIAYADQNGDPVPLPQRWQGSDGRVTTLTTVVGLAGHLDERRVAGNGFRTLVTAETASLDPTVEALALATALSGHGRSVILIDWSPDCPGMAATLGAKRTPGMAELLEGKVRFEDVVQPVKDLEVHLIASGAAVRCVAGDPDADRLNMILDALDEAYEHIVVVAQNEPARRLFEVIEGRFDAGVVVAEARRRVAVIAQAQGTFLDYEVADIALVRLERAAAEPAPVPRPARSSQPRSSAA